MNDVVMKDIPKDEVLNTLFHEKLQNAKAL